MFVMLDKVSRIRGHVDGIYGDAVEGWAFYESDDATCLVEVSTPDGRIVAQGRASRRRPDLQAIGRGRDDFSFRIVLESMADAGALSVSVNGMELPGSPVVIGSGLFSGAFSVQSGVVHGVVTERVAGGAPPRIRFEDQFGRVVAEGFAFFPPDHDPTKFTRALFELPLRPECFGFDELALRAFANEFEFSRSICAARLHGYLDNLSGNNCAGWLLSPDAPQQQFEIDVFSDGERIGSGRCSLPREDLIENHPLSWRSGFDIQLKAAHREHESGAIISIRLSGSGAELFNGPFVVSGRRQVIAAARRAATLVRASAGLSPKERAATLQLIADSIQIYRYGPTSVRVPFEASENSSSSPRRFNIIIPIYRGVAITRSCIESAIATRDVRRDVVVLINDCSPEPEMAHMITNFMGVPGVFLLDNKTNLGFVGSVNRALAFCRTGHGVLLNSDTRVFAGAWDEMERILSADPSIGTVTALSNNATIFSYPHEKLVSDMPLSDISWEELASVALELNAGCVVDVPTGHGFCLVIRRDVLDCLDHLNPDFGRGYAEENDFCMRVADRGWRNVAACSVLVQHYEGVSFVTEKEDLLNRNITKLNKIYPEYADAVVDFIRTEPLRSARCSLDRFRVARVADAGARFALVIQNSLGGGTRTAIQDIEKAYGYEGRQRITLTIRPDGMRELDLQYPLVHAVFATEDDDALFSFFDDAMVDLVLVHQLLGYSHNFVSRLGRWGSARQMKFYMHDFYTICPRVTMLDATNKFCSAADAEICTRCVEMGGAHEASRLQSLEVAPKSWTGS